MGWYDDKRRTRRTVVWLVVSLCILAELVGLGLIRALGANGLSAPVISAVGVPTDPTRERSAVFMFTNERTVEFLCTLDDRAPTSCGRGVFGSASYPGPLALGSHTFGVRAVTLSETSELATYSWRVVESDETTPDDGGDSDDQTDGGDGSGDGGGSSGVPPAGPQQPFDISGDVDGLAPGITKTIALTLRNPNDDPIYVTEITVDISDDSSPPGCPSAPNIALEQATGISASSPVLVPSHDLVVLRAHPRAPTIGFRNQPWNQDVCKGKSFSLTYSGSAHS